MSEKFLITKELVLFTHNKTVYRVQRADKSFAKVKQLVENGRLDEAVKAYKSKEPLQTEGLSIENGKLYVKDTGICLGETFADAFVTAAHFGKASEDILERYFKNVAKNPDPVARDGLSSFTAENLMPITDRGTFLAYRYVNERMFDCHTNTMDNMVGNVVAMPRDKCNPNPNETCSRGLHVCHHAYMGNNGRYQLVVEIKPQDVVAVPHEYRARKMRTCEFRVLCTLDYFKEKLLLCEQAALGGVLVFMTEQTRSWKVEECIPPDMRHRYAPQDAWEWAAR